MLPPFYESAANVSLPPINESSGWIEIRWLSRPPPGAPLSFAVSISHPHDFTKTPN